MKITKLFLTFFVFFFSFTLNSNSSTFENWKNDFKKIAIKQGILILMYLNEHLKKNLKKD